MKITTIISFILVIVGGLNWLLIGLFSFDLVTMLFGSMSILTRIVYSLVGLASIFMIFYACMYNPFKKL